MDELLEQFLIEGRDLVADAHKALERLGQAPDEVPAIDALLRATHTLKGSVALFDMAPAEALLHAAETRITAARKGEALLDTAAREALVATVDQVDRWIDAMGADAMLPAGAAELGAQLAQALTVDFEPEAARGLAVPQSAAAAAGQWVEALRGRPEFAGMLPERGGTVFRYTPDPDCFFRGEDPLALVATVPDLLAMALLPLADWPVLEAVDPFRCLCAIEGVSLATADAVHAIFRLVGDQVEVATLGASLPDAGITRGNDQGTTLRVDGGKLDRLARQSGELTVAGHGLSGLAARAERFDRELARDIRRAENAVQQASNALRASITDLRLVSLAPVLRRLPRLARELAASLSKDVGFNLTGDTNKVDKQIADALFEPLLHLVRNAIDHGVEPASQRVAAGKAERATVALSIAVEGDRLSVKLQDDGRGIDAEHVRAVAVARGLIESETADALSPAQACRLIFVPGFSTADSISNVSGRGVGMDAVLRAIEGLQGTIDIESVPGQGSLFRISLPLGAITTRLLTLSVGGVRYGLRLDQITETLRVEEAAIHTLGSGQACVVRDRTVPILDLGGLIGTQGHFEGDARLILTEAGAEPVALRVESLGERLDALVREPAGLLAAVPAIAGTSVLSDGGVLLVLDLPELLL